MLSNSQYVIEYFMTTKFIDHSQLEPACGQQTVRLKQFQNKQMLSACLTCKGHIYDHLYSAQSREERWPSASGHLV